MSDSGLYKGKDINSGMRTNFFVYCLIKIPEKFMYYLKFLLLTLK